ncbi:DUF5804 family protein [Haloarchaeobius amylolyticus]|uniref:DUF5804 family protein n=1 Tax=Haloarchaeobius amylolyticus TaxID=1198296 RepID=UPI002271A698
MTDVCLIGSDDSVLRYELLSRETAREALSTYDLWEPFENAIACRTVSVGAAVSLCNDLNWYLVRFVDDVFVREPSIVEDEWLSRDLATQVRNDAVKPDETGQYCKMYGVLANEEGPPSLVEPLFVQRTDDGLPEYDLHPDVDETVVVRVSAEEFGA